VLREIAFHIGIETAAFPWQRLELGVVDGVGTAVVGAQRDISLAVPG